MTNLHREIDELALEVERTIVKNERTLELIRQSERERMSTDIQRTPLQVVKDELFG